MSISHTEIDTHTRFPISLISRAVLLSQSLVWPSISLQPKGFSSLAPHTHAFYSPGPLGIKHSAAEEVRQEPQWELKVIVRKWKDIG